MTPDDFNRLLGRRIRGRRRSLGMTQADVAAAIGVAYQQIQKYECAASQMTAARVVQIARVLDVPVSQLFDGLG